MLVSLFGTVASRLRRGFHALVIERRIPGAVQSVYFDCLNFVGIRTISLRLKNGFLLTCLTHCYAIYVEVWQKRDYDIEGFEYGPGSIVFDIGANQGIFSLYAARNGATVYAFEPSAENVAILKTNVSQNNLGDRVHIYECAVTGGSTEVDLYLGVDRRGEVLSGSVSIIDEKRGGAGFITRKVTGVPVNELFAFCGVESCDLMKLDCEGAEYAIIDSISDEGLQRIKRVSAEFHRNGSADIARRLSSAGFDIIHQDISATGMLKAFNRRFGVSAPMGSTRELSPRQNAAKHSQA